MLLSGSRSVPLNIVGFPERSVLGPQDDRSSLPGRSACGLIKHRAGVCRTQGIRVGQYDYFEAIQVQVQVTEPVNPRSGFAGAISDCLDAVLLGHFLRCDFMSTAGSEYQRPHEDSEDNEQDDDDGFRQILERIIHSCGIKCQRILCERRRTGKP